MGKTSKQDNTLDIRSHRDWLCADTKKRILRSAAIFAIATAALAETGCMTAWPSACKLNYRTGETKCACTRTVQTNKTMPDKTKRVSFMCDGKNLPVVFEAKTIEAGE